MGGRPAGIVRGIDRERSEYKHGKKEKRDDGNINICWPITRLVHSVEYSSKQVRVSFSGFAWIRTKNAARQKTETCRSRYCKHPSDFTAPAAHFHYPIEK